MQKVYRGQHENTPYCGGSLTTELHKGYETHFVLDNAVKLVKRDKKGVAQNDAALSLLSYIKTLNRLCINFSTRINVWNWYTHGHRNAKCRTHYSASYVKIEWDSIKIREHRMPNNYYRQVQKNLVPKGRRVNKVLRVGVQLEIKKEQSVPRKQTRLQFLTSISMRAIKGNVRKRNTGILKNCSSQTKTYTKRHTMSKAPPKGYQQFTHISRNFLSSQ